MDTQPIANCCPKCQTPLPPDAPQGLCPKCLFAAVATPTEADQPAGHRPTPPALTELAAAFPQLEILEFIGQGGMGFVFKARQPKLDRLVALKILPQSLAADPTFSERFNREARLLARLNHPGIVAVHDFGVASHQLSTPGSQPFYYLLMEFVDGVNLRQAMQAGRFTPDQALAIVPKICEALQFAHNEGILHRDIKPENILLDAKGRVKIADFGIAKLVAAVCDRRNESEEDLRRSQTVATENLTEAGKTLGSPNYMAPEQLEHPGEVDHRADIYSLGVVFYEMLTGELPLGRFAPPSQKSAADPRVDEVVLRALEKERERRQHSAGEVKTQVETIAGSAGVPPAEPGVAPGSRKTNTSEQADGPTRALPEPRFSRTAIVGACLGILALVALPVADFIDGIEFSNPVVDENWVILLLLVSGGSCLLLSPLLGWVAVSQIRRSAGKLYGRWLAAFDGLFVPLLALDGLVLGGYVAILTALELKPGIILLPPMLIVVLVLDWLIIRRVWRAVNQPVGGDIPSSATPSAPPRRAGSILLVAFAAVVLLGVFGMVVQNRFSPSPRIPANLADSPQELRKLPTAQVIEAGLAKPLSAWPWQELESRAKAGHLHTQEANQIVDDLTVWMRHDYPQGYNQPLFWIGNLLDELNQPWLVDETNVLAFLEAYYGNPSIEPLARIGENEPSLDLTCEWRSAWLNQHSLGFELLNEMRSISVDGRQVLAGARSGRNWNQGRYDGTLKLPKLAPGKHIVRCEMDSAFVETRDMAGLANDAPSKDWPPAKRRWARVCEAEFMVYAEDAEIVSLTDDPALNPVAGGALSCRQVIIRPARGRLTATVSFNVDAKPGLPISFDVTLRLAGQIIQCGKLFAVKTVTGHDSKSAGNGPELTVDIGPLDAQIKEAEILLTPNPRAVEKYPHVDHIWGQEIVISHVPLSRQDLYGARPEVTAIAPLAMMAFGPVNDQSLPEFSAINLASGHVVALPKSVTEQIRITRNKDATYAWMESDGLDIVNFGDDGLVGLKMAIPSLKREDWENFSADRVTELLLGRYTSSHFIFGSDFLSRATNHTCAFKTREGGMGILQITGFTENPRGVKLRYKLVQNSTSTNSQ